MWHLGNLKDTGGLTVPSSEPYGQRDTSSPARHERHNEITVPGMLLPTATMESPVHSLQHPMGRKGGLRPGRLFC